MVWHAPTTWTTNQTVTAAQLNAQLRDNMLETAPAKAGTSGAYPQIYTVAATNQIEPREVKDNITTNVESTTSTSYDDLGVHGAALTIDTGSFALCFPASRVFNSAGGVSYASFDITGTTTSPAADGRGIANQGTDDIRAASVQLMACDPGSNTFTMKYRVSSGTGTFSSRRLCVMAL